MSRSSLARMLVALLLSWACDARAQSDAKDAWIRELPTVKSVRAKIKGADSGDTAAKQAATFDALNRYIAVRAGFTPPDSAPAAVAKIYAAYQSAQSSKRPQSPTEAARYAERGTAFQIEVLSPLLPADSIAWYQATPAFQAQQADELRIAQQRAAEQRVRDAKKTTADLGVLGVRLLEPLGLPACDSALQLPPDLLGIGRGAPQTCKIGSLDAMPRGLVPALKAMLRQAEAKQAWQAVVLADGECPQWMKNGGSCLVLIATADGVAAGALVPTGLDANAIESQLATKYQQPARNGEEIHCGNRTTRAVTSNTVERIWALPGLSVSFEPVSRDCTHGRILIQTSLLTGAAVAL